MNTKIIVMPLSQGTKPHQLAKVKRGSMDMWVDLTILRKRRLSYEDVPVFTFENGKLVYNHFEKVGNLRVKGFY